MEMSNLVVARFMDGRLQRVTIVFNTTSFDGVLNSVAGRLGDASRQRRFDITTKRGVKHLNYTSEWQRRDGRVLVAKYGARLAEGFAVIQSDEDYREQLARRTENEPPEPARAEPADLDD